MHRTEPIRMKKKLHIFLDTQIYKGIDLRMYFSIVLHDKINILLLNFIHINNIKSIYSRNTIIVKQQRDWYIS
jgi:hypothetical protein